MKPNQLRATVIGLMVAVSCFVAYPYSALADNGPFGPTGVDENGSPVVGVPPPPDLNLPHLEEIFNDPRCATSLSCQTKRALWYNRDALPPEALGPLIDRLRGYDPWPAGPQAGGGDLPFPPFMGGKRDKGEEPKLFLPDPTYKTDLLKKGLHGLDMESVNYEKRFAESKELRKEEWKAIFSGDWEDQDRITSEFGKRWQEIINELIQGSKNQETFVNEDGSVYAVLRVVQFTEQLRAIHRLLNPPDRLHPWLKWLLYLSRVTPEMLQFYQAALEGRDQIYTLASKSDGRLQVMVGNRIIKHFVPFIGPEDDIETYALVYFTGQRALPSSQSAVPVAQGGSALPQ